MTTAYPYLVQSTSGGGTASAAITPSLSNCSAGNLLAFFLGATGVIAAPAAPAGWTLTSAGTGSAQSKRYAALYVATAATGTNTFSVTTGGPYNYVMAEFANASYAGAGFDASAFNSSASANPSIAQSGVAFDCLGLAIIQSTSGNTTLPYVPNWTSLASLTNAGEFNAAYSVVASQTGAIAWTQATSTTYSFGMVMVFANILPTLNIVSQALNRASTY